jgi:Zn-dependent peptidase ImmA (M78 family)/DNA-binding XRE family transcriptional regulator
MSNHVEFFGDKLRLARMLHGFTQGQLGDYASVSRQFVHQMESGIKQPAPDVLAALCEILKVNINFFKIPISNDVKLEQCHFRKRRTTPVGVTNRILAFSTIFEQLIEYIHIKLDLPKKNFPSFDEFKHDIAYSNEEIERAAELCRKTWRLGIDTPISRMTRVVENAGAIITKFNDVSDKVDALSFNRKYPIIVENNTKKSVCRMRFDLAHECGHFILHDGIETGDKLTESEANKFASAFLFPRTAFVTEFPNMIGKRLDWEGIIYKLKIRWGMSARAIIYRAYHLKLITAQQYRSANVYLNKSGQTKIEKYDNEIKPEQPELLEDSFDLMHTHLNISFSHIANKLNINEQMLTKITDIQPPKEDYLKNVTPIF